MGKKLLILGHKRHGKDTCAEILAKYFKFSFKSSSVAASEIFLFDALKAKYGYKTPEECFLDRVNRRSEWYDLITAYNTPDKTRLATEILKTNDCYVGMRNYEEVEACRPLFDLIVWVDASERLPAEGTDSMTAIRSQANLIITNNSDYHNFETVVYDLGELLYENRI